MKKYLGDMQVLTENKVENTIKTSLYLNSFKKYFPKIPSSVKLVKTQKKLLVLLVHFIIHERAANVQSVVNLLMDRVFE